MDDRIKVLMVGPDRSVHGGISGVVNNYYDAGINEKVDLNYIGTMVEGSKLRKLAGCESLYEVLEAVTGISDCACECGIGQQLLPKVPVY